MALTKAQKNKKVAALAADLEHSTSAIIGTFAGLTASKDFALRKTVREAGGSYHVVKNKLAAKSSQGTKVEAALQGLKGVSAVAYTSGDPVALAKALSDWVKDNAEFTFKLGIVDGKVITKEQIGALASMPGKEELFSKLLFLINAPATRLAVVTNAVSRNLAVVLDQAREQGKLTGAAAASPAPAAAAEAAPPAEAAPAATDQVAAAHAEEAPTPTEQIAAHPASEADPAPAETQPSGAAQPENSTASQSGEAASSDPVEG
jgi:large subunit ribosomal protein L10